MLRATYIPEVLASLLFAFIVSLYFTRASMWLARRFGIVAHPNARASHTIPTPRLGGLGIAAAFFLHVLFLDLRGIFPPSPLKTAILVGGTWAFVGGLLDDIFQLSPRWKFLFQIAAAGTLVVTGFWILPQPFREWLLGRGFHPSIVAAAAIAFTFLFVIFFMNAYNFMDGMDGQAASFGSLASLALALPSAVFVRNGSERDILVLGTLAGALFGFLLFNLPTVPPHRKTFMGDCGSQFVGYLLAVMCLTREYSTPDIFNFWSAVIVLSPFMWDVVYTLVRRLLRHENIFQAHRTHLYQRLLVAGWSHAEVLAVNFALWGACFVLAQLHGRWLRHGREHWLWVVGCLNVLLLLSYTLFVLIVERSAQKRVATT
jgi:UDP-GlcNAc:undecaprenyl-phosphate GlcNAc-1-phosphate transferase